jgi:hypothetical protein|tara:strand:- start:10688 stop:10912 length:225 start_codon:yes stop_codon:yes gene_type:complete
MTLEDYKTELEYMDWWFDFSDDHRVWRAGHARKRFLEELSKQTPQHKAAWDEVQQQLRDGTFRAQPRLTKGEDA